MMIYLCRRMSMVGENIYTEYLRITSSGCVVILRRSALLSEAIVQTRPATLKIGRYMATTMPPIMPPRKTIMNGSIIAVRFSTA